MNTLIIPVSWSSEGDNRIRYSADNELEMFCSLLNYKPASQGGSALDIQLSKGDRWVRHSEMMNDCRFFLTTKERTLLSSSKILPMDKKQLLIQVESGRILARCNYHIHRLACKGKKRCDLYCRYMFMRCPCNGYKLLLIDENGHSNTAIPPPPDYIDSDIPIRPVDERPLCWMTNRPCDFSVQDLDAMDKSTREVHRQVALRTLYTEESCQWLTACVKCNTSVKILGSRSLAKARMWYCVKYMCKGPVDPKELTVICQNAHMKTAAFPSKKEHSTDKERIENNNVLTLQRILMNACAFCEYSSTQMAACVLGNPAQYLTHHTVLVFIRQALAFQDLMVNLNSGIVGRSDNLDVDLSDFVVSDSESLDFSSGENSDLETKLPYPKLSNSSGFDTTQQSGVIGLQNSDTPFIIERSGVCKQAEGMIGDNRRENTEVCSNPQLDSTLVESDVGSDLGCKLFALFRISNVDTKSILHRGRLFKRKVNDKTELISIPPY